jgi:hypothetical protein
VLFIFKSIGFSAGERISFFSFLNE